MAVDILSYYITLVFQIKRGNYRGRVYNAKPIFLLFILDQIEKKVIKNNRIYFLRLVSDNSYKIFSRQYTGNVPTAIQYPFYHLKNEPFWHLDWKEGKEITIDTPSAKFIRDNINYAHLDNALWDLLQDAENRERLREAIVKHFFDDTKEQEIPMAAESSNTYGQEEATPRQLWALKRATGIDYRGRGLTKAEASEMIGEAIKKAEEQGVDVSSNEPTTRQLNYLKRATGIDYSTRGLTKAEATKMIRELKAAEKDTDDENEQDEATIKQLRYLKRATGIDYRGKGLTKREASKMIQGIVENAECNSTTSNRQKAKMPEPEPSTLEYILSKCKTREEQLEAARKFFGEDK